jgi:hypothetical protein
LAHYTSDELSTDSRTQSLDFPLIAANGNAGREREREKPVHNTETKNAKLERLHSARLIRHDLKATNSRHAKVASEITDSSLLRTIITHF